MEEHDSESGYLQHASKIVYEKFTGTVDQKMVKAFGEFTETAKQEMNRFAR
jgi:hypothetical protein